MFQFGVIGTELSLPGYDPDILFLSFNKGLKSVPFPLILTRIYLYMAMVLLPILF